MIKIHLGKNQKEKVEELYRSTNSPRLKERYQKSGLPGLNIGHGPGRPAKISKKQKQSLVKMAAKSPRFSGYEFNIWTCRHLGIFLNQRFKVKLSPERIRQILHDEDIVMKKPTYLYLKQKPKKKKTICQGN
jgi:transposase